MNDNRKIEKAIHHLMVSLLNKAWCDFCNEWFDLGEFSLEKMKHGHQEPDKN